MSSLDSSTGAVFSGVPSFFRACCRDASYGGSLGYEHAGHELCRHVSRLSPYHIEDCDWEIECDGLDQQIEAGDREGVLAWFVAHYPRCMALVPCRRRRSFIRGVFAMAEEYGVEPIAESEPEAACDCGQEGGA